MQKSYESGKAEPSLLYVSELAELSGVDADKLTSVLIKPEQVNFGEKVEKVERGEASTKDMLNGLIAGFQAIAETMRSMESKMALETTQGQMKASLTAMQQDVTKLVERQEMAVIEIRDLFSQLGAQKRTPLVGVHKRAGQSGKSD